MSSPVPFIPDDAPFSSEQRVWLNGFIAGMQSRLLEAQEEAANGPSDRISLDILYGSQTGNAAGLAEQAAELAAATGFEPRLAQLDDKSMDDLSDITRLIVVVSTYGEGEMPDNAQLFWDALSAATAPRCEGLRFAVLALGDTSYDEFCHAGKLIDTRLEQLGAERFSDRIDCDIDFEAPAGAWLASALSLADEGAENRGGPAKLVGSGFVTKSTGWTRKNPYEANVVENTLLSGPDSAKEIRHIAFDLGDSDIKYEVGDALGVFPVNHYNLVDALLERLGIERGTSVGEYDEPIDELLTYRLEIMTPSRTVVEQIAERAGHAEFSRVLGNADKEALADFLWGRDTLDLLNLNPSLAVEPNEFVSWLRPLQHRAYSISSSPKRHLNQVHLTVAAVRWQFDQREHRGVASTWLADQADAGSIAKIFVSSNKNFRLPDDDDRAVIMVGPGTGVAPFRAFLEERQARGGIGQNWLFFGDQHIADDFIYEQELNEFVAAGVLTRLDLAFSRDQDEKIYVQHRMLEHATELYRWLEDGAYFYVCGDATRMAKDVDAALIEVVQRAGSVDSSAAANYINQLKRDKRYLRDVY